MSTEPEQDRTAVLPRPAETGEHREQDPAEVRPGERAGGFVPRDVTEAPEDVALRLAEGLAAIPPAGAHFLGFDLIAELGRGAFGRVYLARQADLADRPV